MRNKKNRKKRSIKAADIIANREESQGNSQMATSSVDTVAGGAAKQIEKAMKEKNPFKRFGNWFKGLKGWKKAIVITVATIIIAAILIAGFVFAKLSMLNKTTVDNTNLSLNAVDGYINILVLGVDNRDMKSKLEGSRTDMIMIASIEEKTGKVTLTSVYRDTYLALGNTGTCDKITHACVYGGPELTIKTLNETLDMNISAYVVVNFKAVAQVIDAVGGINVDVQSEEIYQLNKYTKQTANNVGITDYKLVKEPGKQKLCGVQAVSYGRIRKGVGDDFKRTERMRKVVRKTFNKMQGMSLVELNSISNKVLPNIETNISNKDIIALGVRLPSYEITGGAGFPYYKYTGSIGGTSYVFADDLVANVEKFHKDVFRQENYTASARVRSIADTIRGRISADAARIANEKAAAAKKQAEEDAKAKADAKAEADKNKTPEPVQPPDPSGGGESNPTDSSGSGSTTGQ